MTIPASQTSTTIDVSPIDDLNDDSQTSEAVIIDVASGPGYAIGDAPHAHCR